MYIYVINEFCMCLGGSTNCACLCCSSSPDLSAQICSEETRVCAFCVLRIGAWATTSGLQVKPNATSFIECKSPFSRCAEGERVGKLVHFAPGNGFDIKVIAYHLWPPGFSSFAYFAPGFCGGRRSTVQAFICIFDYLSVCLFILSSWVLGHYVLKLSDILSEAFCVSCRSLTLFIARVRFVLLLVVEFLAGYRRLLPLHIQV